MKRIARGAIGAALVVAANGAAAHPGHQAHTLFAGLAHPFGLDHLLAMVAVGMWSTAALPAMRRLLAPALFMIALVAGAAVGSASASLPFVEAGVAASVVLLGAMLAAARRLPVAPGLALVALAGAAHGLAHGAELPAGGGFAGYAAGFLATTALLHLAGLGLGRKLLGLQAWAWRLVAAGVGGAGLLLLTSTGLA